jgi:hypothetical protein
MATWQSLAAFVAVGSMEQQMDSVQAVQAIEDVGEVQFASERTDNRSGARQMGR